MESGQLREITPLIRKEETSAEPVRGGRRRRLRLFGCVTFLLVLVVVFLSRGVLLRKAGRFLDISEPPHKVDFVMVLGGAAETRRSLPLRYTRKDSLILFWCHVSVGPER